MRGLLIGLVVLAACGGDDGDGVAVDARPPIDAPFDGHWNLTWRCVGGTCSPRPDLTQTTTLVVDGLELTYGGGPGGEVHVAEQRGACLYVAPEPEGVGNPRRLDYDLCPDGTGLVVERLPWAGTSWRLQAWR